MKKYIQMNNNKNLQKISINNLKKIKKIMC